MAAKERLINWDVFKVERGGLGAIVGDGYIRGKAKLSFHFR
jgi:hypothetical protein